MKRDITRHYEFVIVGSQSILGAVPHPEAVFRMSAEADIYPLHSPDLAEKIEGAIGEGSHFHDTNGYYAQGVGPETAILPTGWFKRVHRLQNANTNSFVGYCLDPLDLFLSKAVAGRDKDRVFCCALIQHGYVTLPTLLELLTDMPLSPDERKQLKSRIVRWAKAVDAA